MLAAASPDHIPDEFTEALSIIEERQEAARLAQVIEKSPTPLQDYSNDDGIDFGDFKNEGTLQDDSRMSYGDEDTPADLEDEPEPEPVADFGDEPDPELELELGGEPDLEKVAELFQLETAQLAEMEGAVADQELEDEEGQEGETIQFRWDQAESDEDIEGDALRAVEDGRWEEIQSLLLDCCELLITFNEQMAYTCIEDEGRSKDDLKDIQGLAYNLKHSHSQEALEDLAKLNKLRSPYIMEKKLQHFSGLEEECYNCCINSCMLFTGCFTNLDACCGER